MSDLIVFLWVYLAYFILCRVLWWSLTDWREDNRYPEPSPTALAPRNPFPTWEVKPWHL